MELSPTLDELYVISDLHLGGEDPYQACSQGATLAAFVRGLNGLPLGSQRALVLNGDVVDFLAEEPARYLDPGGAVQKLKRIVADASFADVWVALREFLARPGQQLAIVLGNHDVEFALPTVQAWLTDWLAAGNVEARGRLVWATDGAGLSCKVGNRQVLCVHGNEVDPWNEVDQRALLSLKKALGRQMPHTAWTPNGGTRLVIDVMNAIKRKHPMIDLLKPEREAAVPMLLAADPSVTRDLGLALRAVMRRGIDGIRMATGFLADQQIKDVDLPSASEALQQVLPGGMITHAGASIEDRVYALQQRIDSGATRSMAVAEDEFLGLGNLWTRDKRVEQLRLGLRTWLNRDKSFDTGYADSAFEALDQTVGSGVHFLIAGHTHLRRALRRKHANCFYYNTGTWMRLIQIEKATIESPSAFRPMFDAIMSPSLSELDEATWPSGKKLVLLQPTVASVVAQAGGVVGALHDVRPNGQLEIVPGSRFPEDGAHA